MVNCKSVLITCGAAVLGLVVATAGDASVDVNRTTRLTFSGPIGLPGVTLPAGTYTFELAAPDMDLDIVRVLSRDRTTVYLRAQVEVAELTRGFNQSQRESIHLLLARIR